MSHQYLFEPLTMDNNSTENMTTRFIELDDNKHATSTKEGFLSTLNDLLEAKWDEFYESGLDFLAVWMSVINNLKAN